MEEEDENVVTGKMMINLKKVQEDTAETTVNPTKR